MCKSLIDVFSCEGCYLAVGGNACGGADKCCTSKDIFDGRFAWSAGFGAFHLGDQWVCFHYSFYCGYHICILSVGYILYCGERGTVFEAYAKDELAADKDIQIAADDSREVRELKQIVNGMREDHHEILCRSRPAEHR